MMQETLSNSELYAIPMGKPSGGIVGGLLQVGRIVLGVIVTVFYLIHYDTIRRVAGGTHHQD